VVRRVVLDHAVRLSGLATRYDETATIYLTGLHLAAVFITLLQPHDAVREPVYATGVVVDRES
jgi:hypothetical protein